MGTWLVPSGKMVCAANIATAKTALGTVAGTAGAVASGVGSTVYKQAGTAGAVAGGIGSTIYKQAAKMMDRNQKLKETFGCYYVKDIENDYHGTIHFTRNELIFSSEASLPQHIKNTKSDLSLQPPSEKSGKDYYEVTVKWGDIKEIDTDGDSTQDSFGRRIVIRTYQGRCYIFRYFLNHQKAFAHLYSLLESSS